MVDLNIEMTKNELDSKWLQEETEMLYLTKTEATLY